MTTSQWQAAVSGQPSRAGHVNQFLGIHSSALYYGSNKIAGVADPTTVVAGTTYVGAGSLAQQFTTTVNFTTQYMIAYLGLAAVNSGCDLLVQLCQSSGTTPDLTNVLASGVVPAEWLSTTNPPAISTTVPSASFVPVPLYPAVSLTTSSPGPNYFIVVTPLRGLTTNSSGTLVAPASATQTGANLAYSKNDVLWAAASAGMTGTHLQYNGTTWAGVGSNPLAMRLRYGTASGAPLVGVVEDGGALVKAYAANTVTSQVTSAYEMAVAQSNPNILCRDDALAALSVGTWTGTGAGLTTSTGTIKATSSGTSVTLVVGGDSNTSSGFAYTANPNTQYTFVAQVKAATTGRTITPTITFWSAGGGTLSATAGTAVADNTTGLTTISVTATAPASTAYVTVALAYTSVSTEIHYISNAMIAAGPSTVWAPPGYSVASARGVTYATTSGNTIVSIS